MRHLAMLWGLTLCLSATSPEGAAGGGPPAPPGSPSPPAPSPAFDPEKAKSEARLAALKDLGFDSEEAYAKHKKAKTDEENAKLSENERTKKLYNEALDARGRAEADVEKAKAEARAMRDALALRDKLDEAGVLPKERKFVEVALDDAKEADRKANRTFDEKKFFDDLRKERPYFFSKDAPAPANTSPGGTPPASPFGNGPQGAPQTVDALHMSDAEYIKFRSNPNNHRPGSA